MPTPIRKEELHHFQEEMEETLKVVVVGSGHVGKSSLIRRFCKDQFQTTYKKTIGADYYEKSILLPKFHGITVRIGIWDCAGQEDFDAMTSDYYQGAHAVILTFSTTDRSSFLALAEWRAKVNRVVLLTNTPAVLVQTKIDLHDQTVISSQESELLAREWGLRFYRVSVKDNVNVHEVFQYLAEKCLERRRNRISTPQVVKSAALTSSKLSSIFHAPDQDQLSPGQPAILEGPITQRTGGKKDPCRIQ